MLLGDLVQRLERLDSLDRLAGRAQAAARTALAPPRLKDALNGTWLGHPVHPLMTDVPIGTWVSAALLDVLAGRAGARAAERLVAVGVAAAVPTAATGAANWADFNDERAQRVGVVHAASNIVALALQIASLAARRQGRHRRGRRLSAAALGALGVGGYLGGHLSYGLGLGVDRATWEEGPDDWTDVMPAGDLVEGAPSSGKVGDVALLLVADDGRVRALSDRCNHMGGPLHEGDVSGGCVRCPWHGSTFRLADGAVVRSPATAPQRTWEARIERGMVQVRAAR